MSHKPSRLAAQSEASTSRATTSPSGGVCPDTRPCRSAAEAPMNAAPALPYCSMAPWMARDDSGSTLSRRRAACRRGGRVWGGRGFRARVAETVGGEAQQMVDSTA